MNRLKSILGQLAAALTVLAAVLTPFLLMDRFAHGVAATGVQVDPVYTGPPPRFTLDRPGYRITVHEPLRKRWALDRISSYVQITWAPAAALPPEVSESLDLNGDGAPDVAVHFAIPRDLTAALRFDAQPLTGLTEPVRGASRDNFSRIIARLGDRIIVRIPLASGH